MLADIITELGTVRVAKACGVTKGCVSHWKRNGRLPGWGPRPDRRSAKYERAIARLAGMSVEEFRMRLSGKDAA